MSIVVKHSSSLKPYKLSFPVNWLVNPYENKNWLHHFNSLRWLGSERDLEKVEKILRDFYKFHCVKKKKNPYYSGRRGDHTAAIRLGVLLTIKGRFSILDNSSGVGICERLIKEEIKNLHSEKLYRSGHNHGLMVDLALMRLVLDHPEYKKRVDLELVLERSAKTVDAMWHASGLTKEHSVSYQEYNLPLTVEYFDIVEKLDVELPVSVSLQNIVHESKRFLGYALKKNNEYFPLGDSFRIPSDKILNKVFGQGKVESARELLTPYSEEEGVYCNNNFFIFRKTVNGRKVHFAATCCWNSQNHKQNDELSFCLEVDGVTIFDDPGYTEFLPWEKIVVLMGEECHTTISYEGEKWESKVGSGSGSYIQNYEINDSGFKLVMHSSRVGAVREIEMRNNSLNVRDCVFPEKSGEVLFNFVLGPDIYPKLLSGKLACLHYKEKKVAKLRFEDSISPAADEIKYKDISYVMSDRKIIGKTGRLSFLRRKELSVEGFVNNVSISLPDFKK